MAVSAKQVAELRARTGAGMMDCKKALEEAGGDLDKAAQLLREWGMAAAAKKAGRETAEGLVHAYIHGQGRIGVLIEVNCETDFVAATDDFRQLVHELAMQVAATAPQYVRRDDVPAEVVEQEREVLRRQAEAEGKPAHIVDKIVEGRLDKFFSQVCLEEQPYIRDDSITVGDLIKQAIAKLGENIRVRRFVRFELGGA
ncbi:translation elongation factor Ts [Thermaerobacter subterraneus]|uniref:Elongation factor Ts n=1 Tax=Thermaerobacter subterraneus DSM 13965 TaxID=867903 RepID=K6NXR8_9FIRM|nr:translation elongation factor Ts [Thermaerobacter subterraneus]EKP93655.1 translation elongation factor Ts [Thermaerobacter subterraneus DSM 13965]